MSKVSIKSPATIRRSAGMDELLNQGGVLDFPELQVQISLPKKNVHLIKLVGRIANKNSYEVNRKLSRLIAGDSLNIVMDLTDLEYINSTGIAIIFSLFTRITQGNGRFVLGGLHSFLDRVFRLMDLPPDLRVFDTPEEAIEALS